MDLEKQIRRRLQTQVSENEIRVLASEYNRVALKAKKHDRNHAFASSTPLTPSQLKWRGLWKVDVLDTRIVALKDAINMQLKVDNPFPSSPMKPPKHAIYVYRNRPRLKGGELVMSVSWATTYAAKKFIEACCDDLTPKWRKVKGTHTYIELEEIGMIIECDDSSELEDIMEYTYKGDEKKWELPAPYDGHAYYVRNGTPMARRAPPPPPETETEGRTSGRMSSKTGPKQQIPKSAPIRKVVIASDEVHISTIAEELGIDARIARGIMRKHNIGTPYIWKKNSPELKRVTELIRKGK